MDEAIIRNKGKRLLKYVGDYVVFDLETTGVHPTEDEIIEISALKVKDHQLIERFSTLVNPQRQIPSAATAVNGITDQMVAGAPLLRDALRDFLDFIGGQILVGHNIHTFDTNFVYDASVSIFNRELKNDYIDTLYMARACLPGLSKYKLSDVSAYFHISTEGAHRALNDCMMNQQCYEQMGRMIECMELPLCPKCGGELKKRNGKFGVFYGCSNYPTCRFTQNV